jgi:hypothetical protein
MNLSLIYLTLLAAGIIFLFLGFIKKNKKLKLISGIFLLTLMLMAIMFFVLLSFSDM